VIRTEVSSGPGLNSRQLALISLRFQALSSALSTLMNVPESSSKSLVCTIGNGGRREDSSFDPHHGGIDLDIPRLDLGEGFILELRSPGHDYHQLSSSSQPVQLTLGHSLERRLSCDLDHGSGLVSSQLNKRDRVERFEVDEFKTACQLGSKSEQR
jgi:hypothetical protein